MAGTSADDAFKQKIVGILFIVVALVIIILSSRTLIRDLVVVPHWHETEARIVHSKIVTSHSRGDSDTDWPDIEYAYTYDEKPLSGRCCNSTSWFDDEHQFVRDNAVGTVVPIYVDPKQPSESRLKSRLKGSALRNGSIVIFCLIFLVIGIRLYRSATRNP